jgi:arylsulfatase A-like enzyme
MGVVLPDVVARRWPAGLAGWAAYLLASVGSLILWMTIVEAIARLRRRWPPAAWPPTILVVLLLPLWVAATNRYYATLHASLPPSAVWFSCRNARYAFTLALEATTPLHRVLIVTSPLVLLCFVRLVTRRPWPPAPFWLSRMRLIALPAVAVLLLLPRAARSADLEGLRSTVGGVGMYIAHPRSRLRRPERIRPSPAPAAVERPNVLILLQESLGAWQWSPWNEKTGSSPRVEKMLIEEADQAHWFANAVTCAGATAVSLPTILTGLAPDAMSEDFTRAPLIWQEAHALGYRTGLLSAQNYDWLNFRTYFLGPEAADEAKTALELGGPRVNDSGVDDQVVAHEAVRFIDAVPVGQPFLLVVQFNGTHRPCWAPGENPSGFVTERCAQAARYVDGAAMSIVEHLRARGRLEDTLVIGTSDHGETFRGDRPPRLESYFEDVTRVPLYVRLPRSYLDRHPDARTRLGKGPQERVSNLDLYPTILDVWGRWPLPPSDRPRLGGASLLRALDADRALVVVSTGEIHDFPWSNEGFALYHDKWKWLCDEPRGCRLFDIYADVAEEVDLRAVAPTAELTSFRTQIATHPNLRRILLKIDAAKP